MSLADALWMVSLGQVQRIATPGQWKVWREDGRVRFEVLSKGDE